MKLIKFFHMNEEGGGEGASAGGGDAGADTKTVLTGENAAQQQESEQQENQEQKEPEKKQEEQKPVVPEKYEFTTPEGYEQLDQGLVDQFTPIAKEIGLTNEQAQQLANLYGKQMQQTNEIQEQEFLKQRQAWVNELKGDPEFGNGNDDTFKSSIGKAQMALNQFGSPELKAYLAQTGLGDNVHLVKAFAKIGAALGEDGFVSGNGGGQQKRAADILFDGK